MLLLEGGFLSIFAMTLHFERWEIDEEHIEFACRVYNIRNVVLRGTMAVSMVENGVELVRQGRVRHGGG